MRISKLIDAAMTGQTNQDRMTVRLIDMRKYKGSRCLICHDPLGNDDGPTCGSEMCEVAWDALQWLADERSVRLLSVTEVGHKEFVHCHRCGGTLSWDGYEGSGHKPGCLHLRAKELLK
jgi:hypothetical protein